MESQFYAVFADRKEKMREHDPEPGVGVSKKLQGFRNRIIRHNKGRNWMTIR
jgi:hypothetical protein